MTMTWADYADFRLVTGWALVGCMAAISLTLHLDPALAVMG
jgi:hypothetical protein